jgi:hypothetical protein
MEKHIPYLLLKMVFWPSKLCCPVRALGKLLFLVNFELYDIANECIRFGGHVDIEVSYKILQLYELKETSILHNLSCIE